MTPKRDRNELYRLERVMTWALKTDVDSIAYKFNQLNEQNLASLKKLLYQCEFPTIFLGRFSNSDLVEFSENLLVYVASFMFDTTDGEIVSNFIEGPYKKKLFQHNRIKPIRTIREKIFGIYMAYLVYFMQPHPYIVHISISVQQVNNIHHFMSDILLPDELFEPLYCIFRLIDSNAFSIIPFEKTFNPFLYKRYDFNAIVSSTEDFADEPEPFSILKSLKEDSIFVQGDSLHKSYVETKNSLSLPSGISLLCKETPLEFLEKSIADSEKSLTSQLSSLFDTNRKIGDDCARKRRSEIRQKAFSQVSRHKRHKFLHLTASQQEVPGNDVGAPCSSSSLPFLHLTANQQEVPDDHMDAPCCSSSLPRRVQKLTSSQKKIKREVASGDGQPFNTVSPYDSQLERSFVSDELDFEFAGTDDLLEDILRDLN